MRLTEFQETLTLLNRLGVVYKIYTTPEFLHEQEAKGTWCAVSIGPVDLNFDSQGNYIGQNSEQINSWKDPEKR